MEKARQFFCWGEVPWEGVFGGSIKTVYGESRGISNARRPATSSGGISSEKKQGGMFISLGHV